MHFSTSLVAAFAACTFAGPIQKRDLTVVTEVVYIDADGEIHGKELVTTTIPDAIQTPSSTPMSEPIEADNLHVLVQQDNNEQDSELSPLSDIAVGTVSYIQRQANNAVRTRTGFVPPDDPLFRRMALFHTNAHRANSSVPALRWNQNLANKAQAWANLCTGDEELGRPEGTGVNAAWSSSGDFNPSDFVSDAWCNGEFDKFPWNLGDNVPTTGPAFQSYGHLSQLLWSTTKSFGCSIKNDCPGPWKSHALCYYSPPGNYAGQFSKVKRPRRGGPTLRGNGK